MLRLTTFAPVLAVLLLTTVAQAEPSTRPTELELVSWQTPDKGVQISYP
jgi:hypothetical protein